jgi:tRNA (guanine-N7-)-methyltransferase
MRLRNVPGSEEAIADSKYTVKNPENMCGKWASLFENDHPLHIEIGMGKGQFITELARQNPDINYVGIEKYSSVLVRALEKLDAYHETAKNEITNLVFICMNAENIEQVFAKNEVNRIYLNFSDPWPKERHAKRRLTSKEFFKRYDQILTPNGQVEFKTDNRLLFDFSLEEIPLAGWTVSEYTYDLHHCPEMNAGNIMTEYEQKFSSMGNPINKLIAVRD